MKLIISVQVIYSGMLLVFSRLQWKVLIMQKIGLVWVVVLVYVGSSFIEQNMLLRQVSGVRMKVGMIVMLLNFLVYMVLMKLVSEKIVVFSSMVVSVISGCGMCIGVKNMVMISMMMLIIRLCRIVLDMQFYRIIQFGIGLISSFFMWWLNLVLKNDELMLLQLFWIMFIIIRFGMMNCMQLQLFILFMCELIRLLKIRKYRVMVIVGGIRVWFQMCRMCVILWCMMVISVMWLCWLLVRMGVGVLFMLCFFGCW